MHRVVKYIDPINVESGVNIYIPPYLMDKDNLTFRIKYFNIGYEEPYKAGRIIMNSWFYSDYFKKYYNDGDEPWINFLFPLNDNCSIQNKYEINFKPTSNKINLTIRDIYYGNELPQYYRDNFSLILVIEIE